MENLPNTHECARKECFYRHVLHSHLLKLHKQKSSVEVLVMR
jgi:hypothetical protein